MPRRRRAKEFQRRLREAVAQAEAEERKDALCLREEPFDPLDDAYWREHEDPLGGWCCLDCAGPNHPLHLLADAQQEIDDYLKESHD